MNFIQTFFQKRTNNMIAQQDFELAGQLMNAEYDFVKEDYKPNGEFDGKVVGRKLFTLKVFF